MIGSINSMTISKNINSAGCVLAGAGLLLLLISTVLGRGEAVPPGIQVELDPAEPLSLRVTLRSGSETAVRMYRSSLPWGNRYSMVFAGVTPSGEPLKQRFPIDDPGPTQVTVEPKNSLSGEIALQRIFEDLDTVLKKSDVLVFCAYKAPDGLGFPRWSGGWVLIPQHGKDNSAKRTAGE